MKNESKEGKGKGILLEIELTPNKRGRKPREKRSVVSFLFILRYYFAVASKNQWNGLTQTVYW